MKKSNAKLIAYFYTTLIYEPSFLAFSWAIRSSPLLKINSLGRKMFFSSQNKTMRIIKFIQQLINLKCLIILHANSNFSVLTSIGKSGKYREDYYHLSMVLFNKIRNLLNKIKEKRVIGTT